MKPARLVSLLLVTLTGCRVGPDYVRPQAVAPAAYEEAPPSSGGWKTASPADSVPVGAWWQVFSNAELNNLEEQVALANQSLNAA
jgi:outer membrane protein TolC